MREAFSLVRAAFRATGPWAAAADVAGAVGLMAGLIGFYFLAWGFSA